MVELLRQAIEVQDKITQLKEAYKEQDRILAIMIADGFTMSAVDGKLVALVDNFAKSNTQFRTTSFRRFEISVIPVA